MKALLVGGTGTISTAVSALLVEQGWELYLLNRGNRGALVPEGAHVITADISDMDDVEDKLSGMHFDVVADFIAFTTDHVRRDIELFEDLCDQYIFISSASAYQKPLSNPVITESTPLFNPYWEYSRNKIACEKKLMKAYRKTGFPITIVRPSHTYGDTSVPLAVHGREGSYSVIERIRQGKPVIIHGDGSSLWTMTHNTDFAKAFCGLMGNIHAIGETYQITSDESLTWNQIYEIIASALGVELHAVHIPTDILAACSAEFYGGIKGDKAHTVIFDNTKIKRAVPGFTATVRFDQGVRRTLDYVLSHAECRKPDPAFDAWTDEMIDRYQKTADKLPALPY
ncbi:MAG TPA: SDR family oxidoreductase [Candidatus Limiplasma sp.]|nr:SDR family oxidoreductase [Candidatus Limiplasma sp.]HRX09756.1 SDR family oxidoreductase [Candidatus Limiplasma sp.]